MDGQATGVCKPGICTGGLKNPDNYFQKAISTDNNGDMAFVFPPGQNRENVTDCGSIPPAISDP
ncbi:hypothetical protein ED312_19085 [Sinomicrobium pectinilyticum]|uniref:Uncharacterized protein n=1 Tax=Sinomicrobium pectinilyticum TaxID=1084421 RepID=A0A3N0DYP6_SINP1|nr:hypothetical protein ED312_19085 [Sinomicrobium pectinilyticum]